jgi:hypothetical protein
MAGESNNHMNRCNIRKMRVLKGYVATGYKVASQNLQHVVPLIIKRTGLPSLVAGTFNVKIEEPYIVHADATIAAAEYNGCEVIKLQRCRVGGIRAVIMRPVTHEGRTAASVRINPSGKEDLQLGRNVGALVLFYDP